MPQVLDTQRLLRRLGAVRRRLRFVVGFRGISWLIAAVLFGVTLACLIDWRIHLPSLVRAVFLTATLGGAGVIAYRYLIRPLRAKSDNLNLALRIEAEFPELNDSLASAVQFIDGLEADSPALRRLAVERALAQTDDCDFGRVIDRRGFKRAGLAMIGACALVAGLVFLQPATARTALVRLASPFGTAEWPAQTRLVDNTSRLRIPQGEAFEIRASLEGVIPDQATVSCQFGNDAVPSDLAYPILRKDKEAKSGALLARLTATRVPGSFRYQIRANDAVTPWREVQVLPPVRFVQLDGRPSPQVRLTYPEYAEMPPHDLADGTANIEAVVGSSVHLRAAVDRPLSAAGIEYRPENPGLEAALRLGPLGATCWAQSLALNAAGQQVLGRMPARLERSGRALTIDFLPRLSGTYALRLEDETGLTTTRLFDVRLLEDPAPQVSLQRPSASLDSLAVLPQAEVTLQVFADDSQVAAGVPVGLRSIYVEYTTQKGDAPRRLVLYENRMVERLVTGVGGVLVSSPLSLPPAGFRARPPRLTLNSRLPLKRLRHLDGTALREGDVITLLACAADFDNVAVNKQPGRSHEVELHLVDRPALEAALHQAQAHVQQELLRLREREHEALSKVDAAEKQWRNAGRLRPEDLEELLQAGETQKEIRGRVGTSQEGLRAEVNRILQTLHDNQLPRSGAHERMEMVAAELERLAHEELEPIEALLTNARKENELAAERPRPEKGTPGALSEAVAHQDEVEKTLIELLARLEPWSTTREIKGETRAILEEERRLSAQTDKLAQELPLGKKPAELKPEQRAELERIAEAQNRLADHTGQLLGKMERIAQDKRLLAEEKANQANQKEQAAKAAREEAKRLKETEPEQARLRKEAAEALSREKERLKEEADTLKAEAEALEKAAQLGRENEVGAGMKRASDEAGHNNLSNAGREQKASMAGLEKVAKALEDRREQEIDKLIKNLDDADRELARLKEEQDLLRKQVKEAQEIKDPAQRQAELQRLARRQDELRKKSQELLRELNRLGNDRARTALNRAGGEMEDAGARLERGDNAQEEQEEALERLEEARQEIQKARREAEDELAREKLIKIADQLRLLKERHEALLPRVAEVHKDALERKRLDRLLQGRLVDLAEAETTIGQEAVGLSEQKLKSAAVFARLLRRSADHMEDAASAMRKRVEAAKDAADAEIDVKKAEEANEQSLQPMRDALALLERMLDALKPENAVGRQKGPMGGDPPKGAPSDGIPYLAQLKALKALQEEINRRTADFARKHPDSAKLTPEEQQVLDGLQQEQEEVKELVLELIAPAQQQPEGGKP